jgi:endothelin-converting enzyme
MPSSNVDNLVPQISITNFLKAQVPRGYDVRDIIVTDHLYYGSISAILTNTPRSVLHAFFQWHIINTFADKLSRDVNKPWRTFREQLDGLAEFTPERWRTCVNELDSRYGLGWMLSGFYVERAFTPQAKDYGDRIVRDIKAAFAERLKEVDWMSDNVKERAAKKGQSFFDLFF